MPTTVVCALWALFNLIFATAYFLKYLFWFIYFIWLFWVLVAACRICSLHCDMQYFQLGHVGPSSLIRDWMWAPCEGTHGVLATGPPGKFPSTVFLNITLLQTRELSLRAMKRLCKHYLARKYQSWGTNPGGLASGSSSSTMLPSFYLNVSVPGLPVLRLGPSLGTLPSLYLIVCYVCA